MVKKTYKVKGMTCNSCAHLIENKLKDKVNHVSASFTKETAEIDFDSEKISENQIKKIVEKQGYELIDIEKPIEVKHKKSEQKLSDNIGWIVAIGSAVLLIGVLYFFVFSGMEVKLPTLGEQTTIYLLFFAGILTGFHCIAMCGGFVVSYTTKNAIKGHKSYKQHFVYGTSKLASYALIGGIFGIIGGIIAFSIRMRGIIAILAGSFMIFYAFSMFGFKFFRKFQFNPKFLTKATHHASKHATGPYKAPFITGLLSGLFIACGPLQAMYLYAMGTGNFLNGFTSLAAFGLGTLPVMIGFGSFATVISHKATKRILKVSAILVLVLGLIMLNRGLTVMGSPISYDTIKEKIIKPETGNAIIKDGFQEIHMEVNRYGWTPNSFALKKDVPVKWIINVKELTGCNNEIIVPDYDLDFKLKKGLNTIEFTPSKTGTVRWSCWMGMIPGSFVVTDSGSATTQELAAAAPAASSGGGSSCGGSCGSPSCGAASGGGCGCGG